MNNSAEAATSRFNIERWPSERPLFALTAILSVFAWIILAVSVIGLIYAVLIGVFFFVTHLTFVAHVKGSAVKLGPDQFPELHQAVVRMSEEMGMKPPTAYILQSGGALNALATRFLKGSMIVLFSDLLEACEGNQGARDMIIGHELAHLKCGHLRWRWLILPGSFIPFLGGALSRAREYTCDRYGVAAAGNTPDALRGLAILAAGPRYGTKVDLRVFTNQRADLNTGLMMLAEWMGTHPPLSKRIAVLNPEYAQAGFSSAAGMARAVVIVLLAFVVVGGATAAVMSIFPRLTNRTEGPIASTTPAPDPEQGALQAQTDFQHLSAFIENELAERGTLPRSMDQIKDRWTAARPSEPFPVDPFDGFSYGYTALGTSYRLWSSGADGESGTSDDIVYEWSPPR